MTHSLHSRSTLFTQNKISTAVLRLALLLSVLCTGATVIATELDQDPFRYRSGVRNSRGKTQLNAKRLSALTNSLRDKTGFLDLHFDTEGFLNLGDRTHIKNGSALARELVVAAVDSPKALVLEDHSNSREVSFAKLSASIIYQSRLTLKQMENRVVKIDFADFSSLRGDRDVLAAFDVGFVVMHEMAHGALDLRDAASAAEEPGECESYINRIRRELNLPERLMYRARIVLSSKELEITDRKVELSFARSITKNGQSKTEHSYLRWNLAAVGGKTLPEADLSETRERVKVTTGME